MKVKVFSKGSCVPCQNVKDHLTGLGVVYEEVNCFDNPEEARKSSIRSVPTVVVLDSAGEEVSRDRGFNPAYLNQLKGL